MKNSSANIINITNLQSIQIETLGILEGKAKPFCHYRFCNFNPGTLEPLDFETENSAKKYMAIVEQVTGQEWDGNQGQA